MAYTIINPVAGILPIANTDAGVTFPNASSAAPSPPMYAGMVVTAQDPTNGMGEFILLLGVASTIVGAVVRYNATTYQTTLVAATAAQRQGTPLAVAMSANLAATWGWYQISGNAVIKKTAVTFPPNAPIFMSATAGRIKVLQSGGLQVLGATTANLATVTTTTSTVIVAIDRPHLQGQII